MLLGNFLNWQERLLLATWLIGQPALATVHLLLQATEFGLVIPTAWDPGGPPHKIHNFADRLQTYMSIYLVYCVSSFIAIGVASKRGKSPWLSLLHLISMSALHWGWGRQGHSPCRQAPSQAQRFMSWAHYNIVLQRFAAPGAVFHPHIATHQLIMSFCHSVGLRILGFTIQHARRFFGHISLHGHAHVISQVQINHCSTPGQAYRVFAVIHFVRSDMVAGESSLSCLHARFVRRALIC